MLDDDIRILGLVAAMLDIEGYRALKAVGPEESLGIFEHRPTEIDLLLSNIRIPRLSGPELGSRLRMVRPAFQ